MYEDDWDLVELHTINDKQTEIDDFTIIYNNNVNDNSTDNFYSKKHTNVNLNENPNEIILEDSSYIFYENNNTQLMKSNSSFKENVIYDYQKVKIQNQVPDPDLNENNKLSDTKGKIYFLIKLINTIKSLFQFENSIFYISIIVAILFYLFSLEKCNFDNELKCWKRFYPRIKILGIECLIASLILSILYLNLLFLKRRFLSKQNFILYIVHIFLFCFDDGIDFISSHGGYNRLFLNIIVFSFLLMTLILMIIFKILNFLISSIAKFLESINSKFFNRFNLKISFWILLIISSINFLMILNNYLKSTCNDWDLGFKNSKMDRMTNCLIEKPKVCYNKILDGLFDFSKFFPHCNFQKIHNPDTINKFYNFEKFVIFPDTRSYSIEEKDSNSILSNIQKDIKPANFESYLYLKKKNILNNLIYLNRTDIDLNKHHFIYEIEYDEKLVKEAEILAQKYKIKTMNSEDHEIYNPFELEEYLKSEKLKVKKNDNKTLKLNASKNKNISLDSINFHNFKNHNGNLKENSIAKNSNNNQNLNLGNYSLSSESEFFKKYEKNDFIKFINEKSEKILSELFDKQMVLVDNVLFIFLDTLSRQQFRRKLPKTYSYIESLYKNQSSAFQSYQFFKYHATQPSTDLTMNPILTGIHPILNDTLKEMIHSYYKKKGFITGHSLNQCLNFEISYDKKEPKKFIWNNFDFEFFSPFCDPSYVEKGKETGFAYGPYSFFRRCLYGKDTFQYVLDFGKKFFFEVYKKERKFLLMSFIDGHEWTNEVIKYMDDPLLKFLQNFEDKETENEKTNNFKKTAIVILSDHGLHMNGPSIILNFDDVEKEMLLPVLNIMLPRNLADSYIGKALELNENRIIGGYDIHNIFKVLIGDKDLSKYGELPFKVMPDWRSCLNVGVPDYRCLCKKID